MAVYTFELTSNSAGVASLSRQIHGQLASIRVEKAPTGIDAPVVTNPVVTVAEASGIKQTVLNGVTVSSTGNYYPRIEVQDNAGAALVYASTDGVADRYQLDGQITVSATTMGDTKTMHVFIQTY